MMSRESIATAYVDNAALWTWQLRINSPTLFRWYLDGQIPTDIHGSTSEDAIDTLRRYAEKTFSGELIIARPGGHRPENMRKSVVTLW